MGEKSYKAKENDVGDNDQSDVDMQSQSQTESDSEECEDISPEEFAAIDSQLDALNSALDDIEQKNDNIHAQLLLLLEENREIRRQMKESCDAEDSPGASQPSV